jgi:hypothetical protein
MNVGRYLRGEDRHVGTARTTQPQQPQRTWVGLTEDEVFEISNKMPYADRFDFAEAIEAKLKEKNNG